MVAVGGLGNNAVNRTVLELGIGVVFLGLCGLGVKLDLLGDGEVGEFYLNA